MSLDENTDPTDQTAELLRRAEALISALSEGPHSEYGKGLRAAGHLARALPTLPRQDQSDSLRALFALLLPTGGVPLDFDHAAAGHCALHLLGAATRYSQANNLGVSVSTRELTVPREEISDDLSRKFERLEERLVELNRPLINFAPHTSILSDINAQLGLANANLEVQFDAALALGTQNSVPLKPLSSAFKNIARELARFLRSSSVRASDELKSRALSARRAATDAANYVNSVLRSTRERIAALPRWLASLELERLISPVPNESRAITSAGLNPVGTGVLGDMPPGASGPKVEVLAFGHLRNSNAWVPDGIDDLSDLKPCKALRILNLTGNPVSDLRPIQSLTNLEELYLGGTLVSDLKPLSNKRRLRKLDLSLTKVTDFSPITHLKLDELIVVGLGISDRSLFPRVKHVVGLERKLV